MVEGARLESVCRGNSTVGSNPTLSAIRNVLILNCYSIVAFYREWVLDSLIRKSLWDLHLALFPIAHH